MERHLWECKHQYYCSEKNYFDSSMTARHRSFDDFLAEEGDADMDYNLVFRWDWTEEDTETGEFNYKGDDYYRNGKLSIFFMGQRKGLFRSVTVDVCRADEPKVIEYLKPRWEYVQALWAPFDRPNFFPGCRKEVK